jgi:pimeloyl-ACP methyl ester carboxylesterase
MAPILDRLAHEGFKAVAVELPGHAGDRATDIKAVAAAVSSVIAEIGMPRVVVGHSFAAMVMRLAFRDVAPPKVVLVAPALRVVDAVDVFSARLGLLPWARRGLRRRLERWDPVLWPMVAGLDTGQMPGAEILVLHDPNDEETPFTASAELASSRPRTTLLARPGAGHSGILSDPRTLDQMADFASARSARMAG